MITNWRRKPGQEVEGNVLKRRLICLLFREERPEHCHVSRCLKSLGRGRGCPPGVGENGSGLGQRCSVLPRVEHEDRERVVSFEDPTEMCGH